MWEFWIHQTRTGSLEVPLELSAARWTRLVTGQGSGSFTAPLSGIPRSLIMELSTGNRYSLAVGWAGSTHCAYDGVILNRRVVDATDELVLQTRELASVFWPERHSFGVNQYNPASGEFVVSEKSHAGAVRAILEAGMAPSVEWSLPVDLPPDGAGSFTEKWRHESAMTIADMLKQVRDEGYEIDHNPYFTGGTVRHDVRVAPKVTTGEVTDLAVRAPGSIVTGLVVEHDWSDEKTGVLGFGNGTGQDKLSKFAPVSGSGATATPVRDAKVVFSDIEDATRLQAATSAEYEAHKGAAESTMFDLNVWGPGPRFADVGMLLNLWSYGGYALPDGSSLKRVVGLSGDLSFTVTPEVESYAA